MPDVSLSQHIMRAIGDNHRLCVAFSGGLDSTVLLHILQQIRDTELSDLQLRAIHVDHGLSAYATNWKQSCYAFCQHWQVDFVSLSVKVDAGNGGIEAAARRARYQALADHLQPGETLMTAQHLNDQCETFMLALKRGSGPQGLSAMAQRSQFGNHLLIRPLLDVERGRLEAYAREWALNWIEDDSNNDTRFDRNFLRLDVLPMLYQRWPHFAAATARSASLCAEQESLLDELLQQSLQILIDQRGSLDIRGLVGLSSARRFALLRRWLAQQGAMMPSRDQLERIWNEVALSRADAEPQLRVGDHKIRRYRQRLYWLPMMQTLKDRVLPWDGHKPLVLPDRLGQLSFISSAANQGLWVRTPGADEHISVRFYTRAVVHKIGRERSRTMKKLWQEMGVPPWDRDRVPLVFYNEQLIAAAGLFVTLEAQAADRQLSGWSLLWTTQ